MKKAVLSFVFISLYILMIAQVPESFNYQVVVRDGTSNDPLVNQDVSFRMSILKGSSSGESQYSELHSANTGALGIVNLVIGNGTDKTGDITTIDWGADTYYLKVEIDKTGGTTFVEMGTTQLLSVPYAMYAKTVASYTETDPVFTAWDKSDGISITESQISDLGNYIESETDPNAVLLTGNQTIAGDKTFSGTTTVPTPVNATDAATKAYVDAILSQLSAKGAIVADADGNIYSTVRIGSQVWMGENLKTTRYRDGTDIPLVTDNTDWSNLLTPGYCWYNNDAATYKATYGAMYNWYAVNTGNLCPSGWHTPTSAELTTLENYLIASGYNYDGTTTGNKIAKALASTTLWASSTTTGAVGNTDYPTKRNVTGFTALPGGFRNYDGLFTEVGGSDYWWSATEFNATNAYSRNLWPNNVNLVSGNWSKKDGFSVRCIKD